MSIRGTQADWMYSRREGFHIACWQWNHPRRLLYAYRQPSGWCIRLVENSKEVKRSFPYESLLLAALRAEVLAEQLWGPYTCKT